VVEEVSVIDADCRMGPVVHLGRTTHRFVGPLAGAALLVAVGGCTAALSPSSADTGPSATPHASPSAFSTPHEATAPAWIATANIVTPRHYHTATLLTDGRVLVAGGAGSDVGSNSLVASAELYDPSSGTWTATGRMGGIRIGHTAGLLPDGTVLVAGGGSYIGGNGSPLASAELYVPSSGQWTTTGGMLEARHGHTATPLPDGTVLAAGGFGSSSEEVSPINTSLASAELYDRRSGSWTATGTMDEGRAKHTATLLSDGTVLVARPLSRV